MMPDTSKRTAKPLRRAQGASALGDLPEWNLADLYPAMDAPELARDLDQAAADVGCLRDTAGRASSPPRRPRARKAGLGQCLREYEALEELIGRIVSYAALVYAGNTTDPQRAKLYGDIQEKMTDASAHLLFFALELNLVDDALIGAALDADPGLRPLPALGARPPEGQALPARGPRRAALPRKVDHRPRRLEPPVRRDDGRPALRHRRRAADAGAGAQPPAGRRSRDAPQGGRGAGGNLQAESARLHADHQHARQGQGDLRPLARLRGHRRFPPPRQPRRAQVVDALANGRARSLSAAVAPLLRDEGEVARHGDAQPLGPQRAAAGDAAGDDRLGRGARHGAVGLSPLLAGDGRRSPAPSSTATGSTRRCGPARRPAPSRTRPCRRRTPTCCSTTWASRAT